MLTKYSGDYDGSAGDGCAIFEGQAFLDEGSAGEYYWIWDYRYAGVWAYAGGGAVI